MTMIITTCVLMSLTFTRCKTKVRRKYALLLSIAVITHSFRDRPSRARLKLFNVSIPSNYVALSNITALTTIFDCRLPAQ